MRKSSILCLCLLALTVFCADFSLDWEKAQTLRPGIQLLEISQEIALATPDKNGETTRPLKGLLVRVDLQHKEYGFVGLWADENHGGVMPDHHPKKGGKPYTIDTRRTTVANFMKVGRRPVSQGGLDADIVLGVNSSPWVPWESPYTHKYAKMYDLTISNGELISDGPQTYPRFVVWRNGDVEIFDKPIPARKLPDVWLCHFGFAIVTKNGQNADKNQSLAPRTCYALSQDRRFLFLLTVDGRQPGYSMGANYVDLHNIVTAAGAWDAINMDGGGSTTLCVWNDQTHKADVLSNSTNRLKSCRLTGMNLGIYLKKPEEMPAEKTQKTAGEARPQAENAPSAAPKAN